MLLHYLYCNISEPSRGGITFDDNKQESPEEQRKVQEQEQNEAMKMRNMVYTAASIGTVAFIVCVGLALFIIYKQLHRIQHSPSLTSKEQRWFLENWFIEFVDIFC